MPRKKVEPESRLDPTLSHGIIAIVLLTAAIIVTLSFFHRAGTVGIFLNDYILGSFFGSIRYTVPLILSILAWYLVADIKYDYRPTHSLGVIIFFFTASSLIHLQFETSDMWLQALEGHGGGLFGMLAWPLKTYLGTTASLVLLISLVTISVLLIFNTSLMHFLDWHRRISERVSEAGSGMKKRLLANDEDVSADEAEAEEGEEDSMRMRLKKRFLARDEEAAEETEEETEEAEEAEEAEEEPAEEEETANPNGVPAWQQNVVIKKLPPLTLLETRKGKPTSGDIGTNSEIITNTFREFGIEVDVTDTRVGPSVTQFSIRPAKGVKLSRITTLSNDLALALAAHPIRIEAPIPGKALVGIEVPNNKTALVSLKELLESKEFRERKHNMMIGLGKDVAGKVWFADLPRMPHLLIAGSTGSGKTVCMNTVIMSLLYQNTAETLRFIMVDPKRVELTLYNGIPHLLTPVITNVHKTINALKWAIGEMDRRFEILSQAGNRDITTYNAQHPTTKLPHIVFVIDELADLMATAAGDVESGIIRLAQMARAVGIHLIVATQRPSVDVITGLMKANIPARIAFSVASVTDSRTILDSPGADKLLGRGDMLFQTAELSKPVRVQGAFISEEEVKAVSEYLKGDEEPVYDESIVEKGNAGTMNMFGGSPDGQDPLFEEAKNAILEAGKASASLLQRRLKVGYARAARILDELEEAGIIGPGEGAKPREILVTEREVESSSMGLGGNLNVYHHKPAAKPATDDLFAPEDTSTEESEDEEEVIEEEDESAEEDETEENEETLDEDTTEEEDSEAEDDSVNKTDKK